MVSLICGPIALAVGLVVFVVSCCLMPLPYPFASGYEVELRRMDATVGIVIGGLLFLGGAFISMSIMFLNI